MIISGVSGGAVFSPLAPKAKSHVYHQSSQTENLRIFTSYVNSFYAQGDKGTKTLETGIENIAHLLCGLYASVKERK
jgi:hypothetical protein